jgi:hypothetical protein
VSELIGAGQPFGVSKRLSYQMTADRYTGRVLYVTFRTEVDLSAWLPPPLQAADRHVGFIKAYSLKRRPEHGEPLPPSFSQYHEACVTVLAGPPGETPRHYNLFMWVDRDWATYKAREALGWPKKLATIDLTETFPSSQRYDHDEGTSRFEVAVVRYGHPILGIKAHLDPGAEPQPVPPFNGFFTVRHQPASLGGEPVRELLVIETRDGWFGPGTFGTAEVSFGDAPDEELSLLGRPEVTGCVLRDVGWVLPSWPARLHSILDPWPADVGDPQPERKTIT